MAVKIKTKYGLIDISNSVIATVVGGAATSNYGVVGICLLYTSPSPRD